jgi:hypothetical protein
MNRNEENSRSSNIPGNNSSKPMDSKKDVERSADEKTDQDFPGYPHYPAKEDIMDQRTGVHRVDANLEELGTGSNASGVNQRFVPTQNKRGEDSNLAALNSTNDEIGTPQNVSNDDLNTNLDIPGTELDDENEAIGEEDEENNYYSLGGDRHESQEEDPQSEPDRGI